MNVYDFDGTIYNGDSSVDFYLFSLQKNPRIVWYLPKQVTGFIRYSFKQCSKTDLKEYFFSFLQGIDTNVMVTEFWKTHINKIAEWYLSQKKESDIVVSASPEFLLKPICKELGVSEVIASNVNPDTGVFNGSNCFGEEKVCRLLNVIDDRTIDEFYFDSMSDLPLSSLAKSSFLIKNGTKYEWK